MVNQEHVIKLSGEGAGLKVWGSIPGGGHNSNSNSNTF